LPTRMQVTRSVHGGLRRWLRESAWSLLATVLGRGSALIVSIAVAGHLGSAEFQRFAIAQNLQLGLFSAAALGLGVVATRFVAKAVTEKRSALAEVHALSAIGWFTGVGMILLVMGVNALTNGLVARTVFGEVETGWILLLCSLTAAAMVHVGTQAGAFAGLRRFRAYSMVQAAAGGVGLIAQLIGLWNWGLAGLLIAWFASTTLMAAIGQWALIRLLPAGHVAGTAIRQTARHLVPWVLLAGLANVLVYPMHTLIMVMLRIQASPQEAATFQVALLWLTLLGLIPSVMGSALMPAVVEQPGNKRGEGLDLGSAVRVSAIVSLVILAGSMIGAPLLAWAYKATLTGALAVLWMAGVAAALMATSALLGTLLAALADVRLTVLLSATWAGTYLITSCFWVPHWGAFGAVAACAVAYAVHAAASYRILAPRIARTP